MRKRATGWHKEDIKAAVRKHGISLEELSEANGLRRGACSQALFRPYFSGEMVIANFLGVSPHQIWPDRYGPDGAYLHPKSRTYHTRRGRVRECQKGAAA